MIEDTQTELESELRLKIIYLEEVIKKVMEFNSLLCNGIGKHGGNEMNPDTTPTPRTDFLAHLGMMHNEYIDRMTMLSRNLERELAEKTNEVARLRNLLENMTQSRDTMIEDRNLLDNEVARLREIVERYRVWATSDNPTQMELDNLKQKYDELN